MGYPCGVDVLPANDTEGVNVRATVKGVPSPEDDHDVRVGVGVRVLVGLAVGVRVGVLVLVGVFVTVGVFVAVGVIVGVAV
jgi:hypothetical protein